MAIFVDQDERNEFEAGTSPTAILALNSIESGSVPADLTIDSGNKINSVSIEVLDSDEGDVLIQETNMTELTTAPDSGNVSDDVLADNDYAYYKTFNIPEDADLGQYDVVYRFRVNGNDYKRTALMNVVDTYHSY